MKKLLLLLLVLTTYVVHAQYFDTGQDPASLKWRQINTTNFQLIYPDYYEDQAQILAQKLEMVYDFGSYSLKYKPGKISVILHTQTVQSNGLVAYAPKRSEFYTTPHQAIYPQDWLEQLALHEFRHVVQIDKLNAELPKIIKIILGEQGTALLFGAYLPWWFIEGDAVVTETVLGNYGRGRLPSFLVEHQAQVVDNKIFSYDKAYLGSFKDYIPNHYQLGYYLVAGSRERYGSDIWEKAIKRVGRKPFSITPFNRALKLETGLGKVRLYESIFDSLATEWKNNDTKFVADPSNQLSKENKRYTNYLYKHWLNDNEIIAYKTGLNVVPSFVKIDTKTNKEKRVTIPGYIFEESVNFRGEWIVWAEKVPDVRWSHSGLSRIRILNAATKKMYSVAPEFKAFAPALSPDLKEVAVVETDFSSSNYLTVYDISSGKMKFRFQTDNNNYFFSPVWLNQHELIYVLLDENGKHIAKVNLQNKEQTLLPGTALGEIKQLQVSGNNLYFISSYSGKNALYMYDLTSSEIQQVYEPRFDVAYPAIGQSGTIALSDYTGDGFRIIEFQPKNALPLNEISSGNWPLANTMQQQEPGIVDFSSVDSTNLFASQTYSKTKHLFNFHSWAPVFVDPDNYEFLPGVSLMSQNKLGTAFTTLGYRWDTSEKTGNFYGRYTYKGWFPVFDFEVTGGKRASQYWLIREYQNQEGQVTKRDTTLQDYKWNETNFSANMRIPLNLSRGAFTRFFQPEIEYQFTRYGKEESTPDEFNTGDYQSLSYRLYYYQLLRRSHQDIYPNFGFALEGNFRHSPWQSTEMGRLTAGAATMYLPGLLKNHGIRLYGGLQEKSSGNFFGFSDAIRFPRGWTKIETEQLQSLSLNYALPLSNPDLSIGGLTYVRRISATFFADYANLQGSYHGGETPTKFNVDISSYGVELLGDVNFLRFYAPVKIGVRTSYLKELEDFGFDFLLSVDFNSL
ncbi:TolB family protein [Draconibacterium sediminis]|uniref:Peptidase MA-like domain-containing protein n=1 Tax=Draconibacterium sediminis TaxID=1544798 RepID=A0A0D8J5C9_9BACT|nr:hypothetical protein [Draconibacterium sediminis]KJF42117.1 hypothetical protein LH29_20065 [Draconibacterium sediminis]